MKKIFLMLVLLVPFYLFSQIGFITYVTEIPYQPTFQEWLVGMSGAEKAKVLNSFAEKIKPKQIDKSIVKVPVWVIRQFYGVMIQMRDSSIMWMRGDNPPLTVQVLKDKVSVEFSDYFTANQCGVFVNKMILYAKRNTSGVYIGTWNDYKTGVMQ